MHSLGKLSITHCNTLYITGELITDFQSLGKRAPLQNATKLARYAGHSVQFSLTIVFVHVLITSFPRSTVPNLHVTASKQKAIQPAPLKCIIYSPGKTVNCQSSTKGNCSTLELEELFKNIHLWFDWFAQKWVFSCIEILKVSSFSFSFLQSGFGNLHVDYIIR